MCGRFGLIRLTYPDLTQLGLLEFPELPSRYNIAPTQPVLAVLQHDGARRAELLRWGLIPSWAKDPGAITHTINARGETVAEKPMYRSAFKKRRCLIPADVFYEWQKVPGAKIKQPFAIRRADERPFMFAGLWEHRPGEGAEGPITSCASVTIGPNAVMTPIHDCMPVILDPRDYDAWLDAETPLADAQALIRPAPDDWLAAAPVSTWVNSPAHDGPRCLELAG